MLEFVSKLESFQSPSKEESREKRLYIFFTHLVAIAIVHSYPPQ